MNSLKDINIKCGCFLVFEFDTNLLKWAMETIGFVYVMWRTQKTNFCFVGHLFKK